MGKASAWEEGRSNHQSRIGGGSATIPSGLDQERRAHRTAFLGLLEGIPKLLSSSGFPKISRVSTTVTVVSGQFAAAALIAELIDQEIRPPG